MIFPNLFGCCLKDRSYFIRIRCCPLKFTEQIRGRVIMIVSQATPTPAKMVAVKRFCRRLFYFD